MVIKFKYTNAKGETSNRKVLVIHQDKDYVQGFDLNKLKFRERLSVKKVFGSKKVTDTYFGGATPTLNYNTLAIKGVTKAMVGKSFRNFKTSEIHN